MTAGTLDPMFNIADVLLDGYRYISQFRSPPDRVKVRFLPDEAIQRWEGTLPALEPKLRDYCAREEQLHELLKKK